ncbi:hypothetical protein ACWD9K_07645 [Streptomyces sp. 900116325]
MNRPSTDCLLCASGAALGAAPDGDVLDVSRAVPAQAPPGHAFWAVLRR